MRYEDALKHWGLAKLKDRYPRADIAVESVTVSLDFDEGYSCCGTAETNCYCSMAESPSAKVTIRGEVYGTRAIGMYTAEIPHYQFNFIEVLNEIVAAGDGTLTL